MTGSAGSRFQDLGSSAQDTAHGMASTVSDQAQNVASTVQEMPQVARNQARATRTPSGPSP